MRRRILGISMVMALLAVPGGLVAQACVGAPIGGGVNAITAQVGFPEDAMAYNAGIRHNADGPVSVAAGYTLATFDGVDTKQHGLSAEGSYELPGLSFSVCPTVGLGYTTMSEGDMSVSTFSVPLGVGFGQSFELSSDMSVTPYVMPQWVWMRGTFEFDGQDVSDDDSVFASAFGATLSVSRFYVGAGVTWYNEDNAETVFSLMAGMPF